MATFPRGSLSAGVHAGNQAKLAKLNGQSQTSPGKVKWIVEAADDRLLRGIPCVGSRRGGAIAGTKPGDSLR